MSSTNLYLIKFYGFNIESQNVTTNSLTCKIVVKAKKNLIRRCDKTNKITCLLSF